MSGLCFVLGLAGNPRCVTGPLALFGLGASGCLLPGLVYPPDARVDPLADVGFTFGLGLMFRLGLGFGRLGHWFPRLLLSRAGSCGVLVRLRSFGGFLRVGIRCRCGRGWLGRPRLAGVDRCLVLSVDRPFGCLGVGLELPPPAGQAFGFTVFGFGLDPAAVEFLAGRAGGQAFGLVCPVPRIPGVLGGAKLVCSLGLLGGRGAGVAGELRVPVRLGLLGLPLKPGGLPAVVVELAGPCPAARFLRPWCRRAPFLPARPWTWP